MKHLLNICNINGAEVEPVDIITFGSPCQDMSVAGKREGMKHAEQGDEETTRPLAERGQIKCGSGS